MQDIKDAIEDEYGVMPHVTCDGQGELSEVSRRLAGAEVTLGQSGS